MSLVFRDLVRPTPRRSVLRMEGWHVWGGSMADADDGLFHLLFARWPRDKGHGAWVTHSEIAHAVASDPLGPYEFQGIALPGAGGDAWDADCTHNPTVLRAGDRYYLYYMGTRGPGEWWDYRNRQRIGVAVADHPAGPWERFDRPAIDVTPGAWDCLMTSNPSCAAGPDGGYVMLYKGVGAGPPPKGGDVLCGVAFAPDPSGPFQKHPEPVIRNPEHGWAVEDSFVWYQDDRYYCVIKDYHGYFSGAGRNSLAQFESLDAVDWRLSPQPYAWPNRINWEDGEVQSVHRLERPQIWLRDGKPAVLFCACMPRDDAEDSFNVHIPLAGLTDDR